MSRKVLIVDDDYSFAEFAKLLVESLGYEAVISLDAGRSVELAVREKASAVLLDLVLPGVDGTAALRMLKADGRTRAIPVILCSITKARRDVQEAIDAGAAAFLAKPLTAPTLKATLDAVLREAA